MTPIEAAADHAVHGTHPGRLAAIHHALGDAGRMLTFAFNTTADLTIDERLDTLIDAALEAQRADVADEVFAAAADVLTRAAARKNGHGA